MNKAEILQIVTEKVLAKIKNLDALISETRSSNNDTKSSMGDKYETSREMLQQEINHLQIQRNEQLKSLQILKSMNPMPHKIIGLGSVIETDKNKFYIAVSLGEILFENQKIMIVSAESPLAKAIIGKSVGENFVVNNLTQSIKNIW